MGKLELSRAINAWKKVRSLDEAQALMADCISGKYIWAPPHFIPETKEEIAELEEGFLTDDVSEISIPMALVNRAGMLTLDSQAGLVESGVSKVTGKKYTIRQKEYVIGVVYRDIVSDLRYELKDRGIPHHFGHLSKEYAEVVTLQNGEPFTFGANMGPSKVASYLGNLRYNGQKVFSEEFLDDIRKESQTLIVWGREFGRSFLTNDLYRSLRASG